MRMLRWIEWGEKRSRFLIAVLRGLGVVSLVIEFITHKHQSSFAMSLTIFPSLTTIFSGGGHHSSPHPTISPQPTIPLTNPNHHAVNFSTR
ncbi:hypothetical protein Hanom_Chr06g00549301 [Helianthus anomalus]